MELKMLRKKLHALIDAAPESELISLLPILENEYTDEFKVLLDNEFAAYHQDGEVSMEEVDAMIKYKNT